MGGGVLKKIKFQKKVTKAKCDRYVYRAINDDRTLKERLHKQAMITLQEMAVFNHLYGSKVA